MPRQIQFTKENIIKVSIEIIRSEGEDALSARSICKQMGCSVSPLFRAYTNMDEIMIDVYKEAEKIFTDYMSDVCDYMPAFKEFGLRLVRFSREDPNLFHYLFLRKGTQTRIADDCALKCLKQTEKSFGLDAQQTEILYRQLWPMVFGIGQLSIKAPEDYSDEKVSMMLSTQFSALMGLLKSGKEVVNIVPKKETD